MPRCQYGHSRHSKGSSTILCGTRNALLCLMLFLHDAGLDSSMVECQRHFQHQRRASDFPDSAISTSLSLHGVARSEYKIRRGTLPVERHSPLRVHSPKRTQCESSEIGSFKHSVRYFHHFPRNSKVDRWCGDDPAVELSTMSPHQMAHPESSRIRALVWRISSVQR